MRITFVGRLKNEMMPLGAFALTIPLVSFDILGTMGLTDMISSIRLGQLATFHSCTRRPRGPENIAL